MNYIFFCREVKKEKVQFMVASKKPHDLKLNEIWINYRIHVLHFASDMYAAYDYVEPPDLKNV